MAGRIRFEIMGTDNDWTREVRKTRCATLIYHTRFNPMSLAWWQVGDESFVLKSRSLLLAPPGVRLGGTGFCAFLHLEMPAELHERARGEFGPMPAPFHRRLDNMAALVMEHQFKLLAWELVNCSAPSGQHYMAEMTAARLLGLVFRLGTWQVGEPLFSDRPLFHSTDEELAMVNQIVMELDEDIQRWTDHRDMARRAGTNPTTFLKLFEDLTHQTPVKYRLRQELMLAAERLADTRDSIESIAEAAGFGDLSHFYKTFRQHAGLSPKAFRERVAMKKQQLGLVPA